MKVKTKKGFINIDAEYQSAERCKMDGYKYSVTCKAGDVYVLSHKERKTYALVV